MDSRPRTDAEPLAPGVLGLLGEPLTAALVEDLLQNVIDPELGVNIVDLGLVYGLATDPALGAVSVEMTLTTPGCPLSGYMDDQIRTQLAQLPQVRQVNIELLWEPAWSPEMMSTRARRTLGWA